MIERDKIIQIFKASPTPTSIVKADPPTFTFVQVNDAYVEMTQKDAKQLIGHSLFEAFPENPEEEKPTGVEKLKNSFLKVIETKKADEMYGIRYDIVLDDGEFKQIFWKVINTPVLNEKHQVEFIINSATNISEQVLSDRENNLMLNHTEDSFILIDQNLIIQNYNELFAHNYKDIFGIEVKKGDSILDYAQPERRETVKGIYQRVLEGETVEGEIPVETNDGTTRHFSIKYKPAHDEKNNIIGSFISLLEKTEEQNAKLDLEKNEARYRALVENGSDVVFILSPEGNPTYISPSIENVLGYSQEEAYSMDMMEVVHPDDLSIILNELEACLEKPGETLKVTPARMRHKNGDYRWMEGSITNMLHDPIINGIVDNFRDITDRVKAEQNIQEAKDQYQSLIQTIDGVVWEAEPDSLHVTYMSTQALPILGHDPEVWRSTIGFWKEHIHPEDREQTYARFKELTHAGKNHELEYRYKKGNGEYIWVRDVVTVIQKEGESTRVRGIIIDINETIEAQEKLRETEKKYRNVVEHSTNMFYQHDTEGVLNYVSPQSKDFLGYPPEEAMRNWTDYITDNPLNLEGEKHTIRAIETGETQPPYELELKTADDRIIWVEVHEAPLIENGEVTGIVGSLTNITERKNYEKQLQKSLERYDYASKATRDAIYDWDIVSDDLHWGEGFYTLFGHKPGEGKYPIEKYKKSVHPDDQDKAYEDLKYTLDDASMDKWSYEYRFKRNDGSYAHVIENGYIIRNEDGEAIRMIGALRDITEDKQAEIQTSLQNEVAQFFKNEERLNPILTNLLKYLAEFQNFNMAEIWLVSGTGTHLNMISSYATNDVARKFYSESKDIKSFDFGEGLPGIAWKKNSIETWDELSDYSLFVRNKAAKKAGIHSATGIPLYHNEEIIGILIFGSQQAAEYIRSRIHPYEILQDFLGAEIRRKQQEEEMLLLFESSPDILAIASPDNRFVRVNPAFVDILGHTEEEITSQSFQNFLHPDDLKDTQHEFLETISGKRKSNNFINRYITKSGETRWISWSSSEVFGEDGYAFAFGRDVTARMELEQLLNQAQQMAKIGAWEVNLQTGETKWSAITREIHEVDEDFVPTLENGIEFYREGESRQKIEAVVENAIEKGKAFDTELQIVTAKGNIRWVRAQGEPDYIDGKCVRIYGSFQDITDKKEAEIELEEAYKEKEAILESIDDAFFTLDKKWTVTYWNIQAERLLQTPKQKVLNQNLWDIFDDAVDNPSYTNYHRAMHQNVTVTFEDYYEPIDKWFDISAYPSPEGISVFFKDITERKKSQQELERLNTELENRARELAASNEELEQFAYVASHDLQEPLRMVTSFLTQLEKKYTDKLDDKANQYINFAVDGATRMRQIILDLLNYSRLNQEKSKHEIVDLNDILEDVKLLEGSHIKETGAQINSAKLPIISANPGSIKQVFQNLINNALKYHETGNTPVVKITSSETETHWHFEVKDNGIGINEEFQDTIFQIFQRLHTRDQYSGTGIGLAVTRKIIERHGGEIWLKSKEGKGSTFFFTIAKE